MKITLDHTVIAVNDRQRGAAFLADLLGLKPATPAGPFMAVKINSDLTFDFDDQRGASPGHYAFRVDDATLQLVLDAAERMGAKLGSGPEHGWDGRTFDTPESRGVYVQDPDGHAYEFFTRGGK